MEKEIKERILSTVTQLFMRLGIRSVTMDDVARELSMSKKTLYQYFDNKDTLVSAVVFEHLTQEEEEFFQIADESENAIHELIGIAKCIRTHVSKLNPSTLYDLKKYHAQAWDRFMEFKHQSIKGYVQKNIERGVQEGFYRGEIDPEVLAIFRVEQVEMIFDPKIFPSDRFDPAKVQLQLFDHFVHGMLTQQGKKLYEEYQKNEMKVLAK